MSRSDLRHVATGLAALALCAVAACGDDATGNDPDAGVAACPTPKAMRLQPLVIGASWTYAISEPMVPARNKTSTIEALEDIGDRKAGVLAYRQKTEKLDGSAVSWSQDLCTSVVRHREKSFDLANVLLADQFYLPSKLRVDETPAHVATGAAWTLSLTEIEVNPTSGLATMVSKDENWSVVAASESVTVPAGTFTAVHLRKVTSGAATKDYWYAAGVGKVKETGEQTEELTAYTIP
jgi:hypothetical protein